MEGNRMTVAQLLRLRQLSLLFLLPGLAGLIVSAMFSTYYLESLPKWPVPEEMRTTPREIRGSIVYQTVAEDRTLSILEYSSIGVFLVGLGLGLVFLDQFGGGAGTAAAKEKKPETAVAG
jgi:uncharacterized membrane-anchored protein YitT (DUF2179 family)